MAALVTPDTEPLIDDNDDVRPASLVPEPDKPAEEVVAAAAPPAQPSSAANGGDGSTVPAMDAPPTAAAEAASTPAPPAPPPPAPPPSVKEVSGVPADGGASALQSSPIVSSIMEAESWSALEGALGAVNKWEWQPDHAVGVERAKTYVQGSDREVLAGFYVQSINEWRMYQQRVIVVTRSAYYRVTYSPKHGRIDHYQKTPLQKLRVLEKTEKGLKVYTTEQDGNTSVAKKLGSWFGKAKEKDEFEHAREYLPLNPASGESLELVVDVMAATFHKAAALLSAASPSPFAVAHILTTDGRKQILADRKEAQRLAAEKEERESATADLQSAIASAAESRDFAGLPRPIKRCKKAVDVDGELIASGEALLQELQEEKRERELQERLAREKAEREAAAEELENAIAAAKESRDAGGLAKPIKRCKKAVDFPAEELGAAEALKAELEEEKKERERQEKEDARLAAEKVEREAAAEELAKAVEAATAAATRRRPRRRWAARPRWRRRRSRSTSRSSGARRRSSSPRRSSARRRRSRRSSRSSRRSVRAPSGCGARRRSAKPRRRSSSRRSRRARRRATRARGWCARSSGRGRRWRSTRRSSARATR